MTDSKPSGVRPLDLIHRMDAVQACQVGPSDEWAKATKDGYNQAATDCSLNIMRIEPAQPDPVGYACAIEQAAAALEAMPRRAEKISGQTFQYIQLFEALAAIRALTPPADRLAVVLAMPEVRALVEKIAAGFEADSNLTRNICCDGQMCGCQGSTAGEYAAYQLRAALVQP